MVRGIGECVRKGGLGGDPFNGITGGSDGTGAAQRGISSVLAPDGRGRHGEVDLRC